MRGEDQAAAVGPGIFGVRTLVHVNYVKSNLYIRDTELVLNVRAS